MSTIRQRALVWIGKRLLAAVVPVLVEKVRKTKNPQHSSGVICGHCGYEKPQCSCSEKKEG
ncbi:MAG: hypothetical protein AB8C84_05495 [Oligoflexales bacterium]